MNGVELISLERDRQIVEEGWSSQHDDCCHEDGQLARAACCYASVPHMRESWPSLLYSQWPWDKKWWKPSPDNRIKELVKAGALIAAEIDRLIRLENQHGL